MAAMFRKVTARERIIGWYSTGPKIRPADPDIDDIVRGFCASGRSLYLICKVEPTELGLPTETYVSVSDESSVLGVSSGVRRRVFEHVPCSIGALEAEEVGTEHLLRDVKDAAAVTTLAADVSAKLEALRSLTGRLRRIRQYVEQVAAGQLPIHNEIMYALQDVLNRLPRLGAHGVLGEFGAGDSGAARPDQQQDGSDRQRAKDGKGASGTRDHGQEQVGEGPRHDVRSIRYLAGCRKGPTWSASRSARVRMAGAEETLGKVYLGR
eukprot:ctg_611.g336